MEVTPFGEELTSCRGRGELKIEVGCGEAGANVRGIFKLSVAYSMPNSFLIASLRALEISLSGCELKSSFCAKYFWINSSTFGSRDLSVPKTYMAERDQAKVA